MGRVLVVGLCCVDVVNRVQKFPEEDSDTRVFDMETVLGGNAANNVTVLSQFCNEDPLLFASLPSDDVVLDNLIRKYRLSVKRIPRSGARCPISTAIVNEVTGTRTILHYRGDLPEITALEFINSFQDFDEFSWIHFEGRNFEELQKMLEYCKKTVDPERCKISVELEKVRDYNWHEKLVPFVDVVFMSKDFARKRGWTSAEEAVNSFIAQYNLNDTVVIVPWGEKGVTARHAASPKIIYQEAFPPARVIDTLGAGDTFIGAALHFLNSRCELSVVLEKASKVAGRKCGQKGLCDLNVNLL